MAWAVPGADDQWLPHLGLHDLAGLDDHLLVAQAHAHLALIAGHHGTLVVYGVQTEDGPVNASCHGRGTDLES